VTGLPLVGVLACQKLRANGTTYSRVNDNLAEQLSAHAGVATVLIGATRPDLAASVLSRLDGLVLPGSGSFVHPRHFGAEPVDGREYDEGRDAAAFALLAAADLPVLASCRGMQELAVHHGAALGVVPDSGVAHRVKGPDKWLPAHGIEVRPGGALTDLVDGTGFEVNSQHSDHVAEVPDGMRVEAVAPDGVVEAISVGWPERFMLGIQWHFEHGTTELDRRILSEFGQRCRAWAKRRIA